MKSYTFEFIYKGEQLTTATFNGTTRKEARRYALRYKAHIKTDFPKVQLNKVKVI